MHRRVMWLAFGLVFLGVLGGAAAFTFSTQNQTDNAVAVLTAVALILGVLALVIALIVESADYKAQQNLKTDIANLLISLNWMLLDAGLTAGQGSKPADLDIERSRVREFLNSTSGFALYGLVHDKSREAGDRGSPWRILFAQLWEIATTSDASARLHRALDAQATLKLLTRKDLRAMAQRLQNIESGIALFSKTQAEDVLITATTQVFMKEPEIPLGDFLRRLNSAGVVDHDVDLFLGVLNDDADAVKSALDAGADPHVTEGALRSRYGSHPAVS